MSVVVKRAIFISNIFFKSQRFSTQWYLHQERTTLPNRKAVRSTTDTDKIEKEKMMKIQNGSYASEKPEKIPVNYILVFFITIFCMTELNAFQQGFTSFPFSRFMI